MGKMSGFIELNVSFSETIREATKEYLEKVKMKTLKKALFEQCEDTAKLNLVICNDFKYVDGVTSRFLYRIIYW